MRNKNQYPENWTDEIRPTILKRDNYKCTSCGVKHRQYVATKKPDKYMFIDPDEVTDFLNNGWKVVRTFLQVAHIDQTPSNCDPDNLKTLCPRCHFVFDKRYNLVKRIGDLVKPLPR